MNPTQKVPKYKDPVLDATGKQIGVAVFDPNTGKALQGAEAFNPNTGTPITSNMLAPKAELKLPEATVDTTATSLLNDEVTKAQSAIEKEQAKLQTERNTQVTDISKLIQDIANTESKQTQYAIDAGADIANEKIQNIDDEMLVQSRALKAKIEQIRSNPQITQNMASLLVNDEERKAASYVADLSITKSILSRDYDKAIKTAERKVEAELAPMKAALEAKKFVFDNNKDYFNTVQKAKFDRLIKEEDRKYNEEKDKLDTINKLVITAQQNGADQATIDKIRNAKDTTEASVAIGKYASDPLERKIKEAQLAKINQDMSQDRVKFGERNAVVGATDIISTLPKAQQDRYYKLQNDFDTVTKTYRGAIDAQKNLQALSKDSTAQDQTAIIFSYMKTLDPTSTVREGEFALVGKTAGLSDLAVNALKKLDSGKRLNDQQIKDIVGASSKLSTQAKKNLDATSAEFDRRASKFGLPTGLFYEPQEIPKLTEDEFVNTLIPEQSTKSIFSVFNTKFR